MIFQKSLLFALMSVGMNLATTARAAILPERAVEFELQPIVTSNKAEMRVVERLPASALAADHSLELTFATMAPSYKRTADQVVDLAVTDDLGLVPLSEPTVDGEDQVWQAKRQISGDVTLRYRVPAAPIDIPHSGPITYLQTSGGGLSGIFASFLLAPKSSTTHNIKVHWQLLPGQRAMTNRQFGDLALTATFSALAETLFVVGPLTLDPAEPSEHGLSIATLAVPPMEVRRSRPWFAKAFKAMRSTFSREAIDTYHIMVFSHDRQAFHSGTSFAGGFLFFVPSKLPLDAPENRQIIAHEMVHSLASPYNTKSPDWYNEGIADYSSIVVPEKAGLYSFNEYLDHINAEAAGYYLNKLRNTPNAKIPEVKWTSPGAWSLGYTRGALYFANLDAGLRRRGSTSTVFQLIVKMNELIDKGASTEDAWVNVLNQSGAGWAVEQWNQMIQGALLKPEPGSFGDCVVARAFVSGHYDLGFSHTSLRKGGVIGRMDESSHAFKAGLREGDVLRETFDENEADTSFDSDAILKVTRGNVNLDVKFSPRTGNEISYRWFPKSGQPDHPCL